MATDVHFPLGYPVLLSELKAEVRAAQRHARRVVNTQLVELYWRVGNHILHVQSAEGWGTAVVARLAKDLREEFPTMKGLSPSNLQYMRGFAASWPSDVPISQQAVGKLPWGHIITLLDKVKAAPERDWYAAQALDRGWSRSDLVAAITSREIERVGAATANFVAVLPDDDSRLAQQLAKDPYVFDFLSIDSGSSERDLEDALTSRMVDTLREMGVGFAFVGRQVRLVVDGDGFFVDLLFFHTEQLRYIVVELKTGKFEPFSLGQLGFYVALVDEEMRRSFHRPTIGILICGRRNERTVRYALLQAASPMAISTYSYDALPARDRAGLPTVDQITAALDGPETTGSQVDGLRGDSRP